MIPTSDLKFLHWYSDSGHGWLGVPVEVLIASGVAGDISHCSYLSKKTKVAYLEEDCDAPKFLAAIGFQHFEDGRAFPETTVDGDSFIRRLPSYDVALVDGRPAA